MAPHGIMARGLILLTTLVFLIGPMGGSSISEGRSQLPDFDMALSADADPGQGGTSSEAHLLVKRTKGNHVINNGLLKVYRNAMPDALNRFHDQNIGENGFNTAHRDNNNQDDNVYQHAIADEKIRGTMEKLQTNKEVDSKDDPNSVAFSNGWQPLIDASGEYLYNLINFAKYVVGADIAEAYKHEEAIYYGDLDKLRRRVIKTAGDLTNKAAREFLTPTDIARFNLAAVPNAFTRSPAWFDEVAYETWCEEHKGDVKKMQAPMAEARAAVINMLREVVDKLPVFAAAAAIRFPN